MLFVVTDNKWLFNGICNICPDMCIENVSSKTLSLPTYEEDSLRKTLMIIDCDILKVGVDDIIMKAISIYNNISIIWLNNGDIISQRNFSNITGGCVIPLTSSIKKIKKTINNSLKINESRWKNRAQLTNNEKKLLPYLLENMKVKAISKTLNKDTKTIYNYRSRILRKLGFKTIPLMKLIYRKNSRLFNHYWL